MQAIQLMKYGKPEEGLRLVEIAEPGDPKSGQILIRVEYAPINDSDLLVASGNYAVQPTLPSVVGNEGAGKVLSIGDGVPNVNVGDRVVIPHGVFSWAEKVLAPAGEAIVLPSEIDPQQASMLSINPPAAALLLEEFVSLKPGDWIVQNAANSGVGRAVIAFAKQSGVRTINIVRRSELIHELKEIGADIVVLAGPNTATEANRATGGALVRLALDGVGGDAIGTLLEVVGWDAKIVCYAAPTREAIKVSPFGLVAKHATIHAFFMYYPEYVPRIAEKIRASAALVASHQLRAPIAAVYPVRRFDQALAHALAGGKVLLDFMDGAESRVTHDHTILVLLAIAGVAATFAGFSGVVAAFGRRADGEWLPEERFRLTNMLVTSLVACLFAFIPSAEELVHVPEPALWTTASTLLGAFCAVYVLFSMPHRKRLDRSRPGLLPMWATAVFILALCSAAVLQALNATAIVVERQEGPYVIGLLLLLIAAGLQFAFLVLAPLTFAEGSDRADESINGRESEGE